MNLLTVLVILLPLAGCLVVLALPERVAVGFCVYVSGLTLAAAVGMVTWFDYGRADQVQLSVDLPWIPALGLRLHLGVDGISLPLVVLTALLCALCAVYLTRPAGSPDRPRALVSLLLLAQVGMTGTFLALDLLLFFMFFEVVLVPMYAVIAGWGGGPGRVAAARQFILYTLLGSGVLLTGLLVIYTSTSTLDILELTRRGGAGIGATVQVVAFLLVAGGLAVKVPVWPLHSWLPDAHTEAPTVGSVLLAGVLLKMGSYGLVRIAVPVLPAGAAEIAPVLGALGVVGIVYAALACLAQRDLKRLIAFSSVGHMGFVLLGIATLTPAGLNGALFANLAHGLITGLLFFLAGGLAQRCGDTDIAGLGGGLLGRAPRLGGLLVFAAIASLGLPGLAGFWGELLALLSAFQPAGALDRELYLGFMAVAGLGAVLTAGYLLVMLRRVAQGPVGEPVADVSAVEWVVWAPLVVLVVVAGLWPRLVLGVTDGAVRTLLGGG
ncbi:MAG TPA: NADH-quinone oxidoreductase subunit M [Actinophytocola sp.]|uniref:complex I subunit 4 family protein n=1 Tax=Actinophytocola sp. TaxID=1872138 RepID=UPI002DBACBB5|nr:NADH-quinone oxidoreductase subunit M [Actinophytocola sp.]HEU5471873.1 NADH-quinone oxidoreductase subunit M [Actinophytocola sp.]